MRRNRFLTIAAAAAMALGLGGIMSASAATSTVVPGQRVEHAAAGDSSTCTYTNVIPADRYKGLPTFNPVQARQPYTAVVFTTQGAIAFQALTTAAPCTTDSFRFLADHGYFDQTHCHRLTTQGIYVLQCGDPTGTGAGGPGYQFPDENLTGATYPAGTVAMANAGPNTNGSQFFFCWKASPIPPLYTPFGRVVSGMNVLLKIAAAGDDQQNGPGDGFPSLYVGIQNVQILAR
jgi:peptidyl-prolyl cis-trans isomerase B (cyclophilin B)